MSDKDVPNGKNDGLVPIYKLDESQVSQLLEAIGIRQPYLILARADTDALIHIRASDRKQLSLMMQAFLEEESLEVGKLVLAIAVKNVLDRT